MKSAGRFLMVALATIFCLASSVFGQTSAAKPNSSLHFSAPVLALAVQHRDRDGGGNGCSNKGGGDRGWDWGGWGGGGWGGGGNGGGGNGGWGGGNGGGGCSTVPEGGSSLTYLSLVGLCCLGVGLWKSRRQPASSSITN
jgi:hypothetical protein